jgi:hypothetical protein
VDVKVCLKEVHDFVLNKVKALILQQKCNNAPKTKNPPTVCL